MVRAGLVVRGLVIMCEIAERAGLAVRAGTSGEGVSHNV